MMDFVYDHAANLRWEDTQELLDDIIDLVGDCIDNWARLGVQLPCASPPVGSDEDEQASDESDLRRHTENVWPATGGMTDGYEIGDRVMLHSLNKESLNGQLGTVTCHNAETERWGVELDNGESKAVKAVNLWTITEQGAVLP